MTNPATTYPLRILITGGTIDKVHDMMTEGLAFEKDGSSQVPNILANSRCYFAELTPLLLKDSLEFTDTDRDAIAAAIAAIDEPAVVVTHGTGTMGLSARRVAQDQPDKTIVFTGAMRPYSLGWSDGAFNLGGAIIAAQTLPAGVYGVMNGRVFPAEVLNKNTEEGRFDI